MNSDFEKSEQKIEIISDEDWKSRVKAEDAALDEKLKAEQTVENPVQTTQSEVASETTAHQQSGPQIDPAQIPAASFPLLVSMFSTQAMTSLGMLPHPMTGQVEFEPALAKHYIDLLGVLEKKTAGNLTVEEKQMLETTLHELRMMFVQLKNSR